MHRPLPSLPPSFRDSYAIGGGNYLQWRVGGKQGRSGLVAMARHGGSTHAARHGRREPGTTTPGMTGAPRGGQSPQGTGMLRTGHPAGETSRGRRRPPPLSWKYMSRSSIPGHVSRHKMHTTTLETRKAAPRSNPARPAVRLVLPHGMTRATTLLHQGIRRRKKSWKRSTPRR